MEPKTLREELLGDLSSIFAGNAEHPYDTEDADNLWANHHLHTIEQLVEHFPKDIELLHAYAHALYCTMDEDKYKEVNLQILRHAKKDEKAIENLSILYEDEYSEHFAPKKAIACYKALLKIDPENTHYQLQYQRLNTQP